MSQPPDFRTIPFPGSDRANLPRSRASANKSGLKIHLEAGFQPPNCGRKRRYLRGGNRARGSHLDAQAVGGELDRDLIAAGVRFVAEMGEDHALSVAGPCVDRQTVTAYRMRRS